MKTLIPESLLENMTKFKEIAVPDNEKVSLRIPVNDGNMIQIDVLVGNEKIGSFSIPNGITGVFTDLGSISYSKPKKSIRWKFPLELTSVDIKTGIVNARFERKKKRANT